MMNVSDSAVKIGGHLITNNKKIVVFYVYTRIYI